MCICITSGSSEGDGGWGAGHGKKRAGPGQGKELGQSMEKRRLARPWGGTAEYGIVQDGRAWGAGKEDRDV
ncbi:hypothetical protein [uncultured Acetatifactor sp.]|uniref:hypothetical protein n=1 Tax=uncultured Acetatifactor sp. TaxID=1671927 RepID=UPI00262031E6|nr:hypothetical protein [uncultured Acetatifactor sp.]